MTASERIRKARQDKEFPKCGCGERKVPYSVFFVEGAHDLYVCPKCGPK